MNRALKVVGDDQSRSVKSSEWSALAASIEPKGSCLGRFRALELHGEGKSDHRAGHRFSSTI